MCPFPTPVLSLPELAGEGGRRWGQGQEEREGSVWTETLLGKREVCAQGHPWGAPIAQLTDVSSEHEAMILSMKGFHLMSSTLP